MSKSKELPTSVPPKEIPFHFDQKAASGHRYTGDFIVKVAGTREISRIGIELARLGGGVNYDDLDGTTAKIHYAIAFSRVCLIESPKWFHEEEDKGGMNYGLDTMDLDILVSIFSQAKALVDGWREQLRG